MKLYAKKLRAVGICISPLAFMVANQALAQAATGVKPGDQMSADPVPRTQNDDANSGLTAGEIVVTAQRRGESIQRVPISISAYAQKTLDRQGVRDVQDDGGARLPAQHLEGHVGRRRRHAPITPEDVAGPTATRTTRTSSAASHSPKSVGGRSTVSTER